LSQKISPLPYDSQSSGYFFVEVSDTLGHIVQSKIWQLTKGNNKIDMNLLGTEKVLYFIRITGQGGQIEKKIIHEL